MSAMRQMIALARKEWRAVVDTPLGYVVAVAFLLASGFFFGSNLFLYGQADMRGYFDVLPMLLMFFVPAISMRMLAEEQRNGTFELLATLPVATHAIVSGKFLALLAQVAVLMLFTLLYPLSLATLGNLDGGQLLAAYVAAILMAALYVSVGLYASALSRHAIVAYVLGFGFLFALFVLSKSITLFPPAAQSWIMVLSPLAHYQSMLRGVIALDDLAYFLSGVLLFLSLSWFQLERRRWQ